MYVISYDISNDRLRNKVAKVLSGYGKRVQYSVFECRIQQKSFEELYIRLALLMADADEGSIRFYHLCGKCEQKIQELGLSKDNAVDLEDTVII